MTAKQTVGVTLYEEELQMIEDDGGVTRELPDGTTCTFHSGESFLESPAPVVSDYDMRVLRDGETVTWNYTSDDYVVEAEYGGNTPTGSPSTSMEVSVSVDVDTSQMVEQLRAVADAFDEAADSLEDI